CRCDAGPDCFPVHMHRARAAKRLAATELRSGETDCVADDPQERSFRFHIHSICFPIDSQGYHGEASNSIAEIPLILRVLITLPTKENSVVFPTNHPQYVAYNYLTSQAGYDKLSVNIRLASVENKGVRVACLGGRPRNKWSLLLR